MAKTYRVRITQNAERDVEAIRVYIAQHNPQAAAKWGDMIEC